MFTGRYPFEGPFSRQATHFFSTTNNHGIDSLFTTNNRSYVHNNIILNCPLHQHHDWPGVELSGFVGFWPKFTFMMF